MVPLYKRHDVLADMYLQGDILSLESPYVKWYVDSSKIILVGYFEFKDIAWQDTYSFLVEYKGVNQFQTWVIKPDIVPHADIHMYLNKSLCLFYPTELTHRRPLLLSRSVVPKCRAWADNYELWRVNGNKWVGNQYEHGLAEVMIASYEANTGRTDLFR